MTKQSKEQRLAEKFKRREILRMTIAQKGDDLFFILDGVKVAVRGKPGTPQAKTWVPLVPGRSVIDTSSRFNRLICAIFGSPRLLDIPISSSNPSLCLCFSDNQQSGTGKEDAHMRYKAKSVAALDIILGGLPAQMRVEVDPGIEVPARPLANFGR